MIKPLASILCFVLAAMGVADVRAADRQAIAVEGAYLLIQADKYQRVLSLDQGGGAYQVSEQEPLLGFTGGQGAWKQTGPDTVVARIVDFNFDLGDGKPTGSAVIVYTLTFTGPESGKYQRVSGNYVGKSYAVGQNPLNPTEPPIRTFGVDFTGQRITAN